MVGGLTTRVPETDPEGAAQLTAVFEFPVTVAVNCWVPAEATVAPVGEMLTETVAVPHVPAARLLLKPLRTLPEPISAAPFAEMPEPSPVPPTNVLLFTQAFLSGGDRYN